MTGDEFEDLPRGSAASSETQDVERDVAATTDSPAGGLERERVAAGGNQRDASHVRARDPVLVPGIYNYCLRRCGRCPFTSRCFLYRENEEGAHCRGADLRHGDAAEGVAADLRRTIHLVRDSCERAGIDPDEIDLESMSDAEVAAGERLDAARTLARCDPLSVAAQEYESAAYEVVDPLRELSPFHDWPPDVSEALDTISWNAGAIRAKLYRAIAGRAESKGEAGAGQAEREGETDGDPVQNDRNGSAKVARLAIAESIAAWDVLFVAGETPYDAPIRQRRRELEQMDDAIARRFAQAMSFVRPGFDEPDVAADRMTVAPPFQPRWRLTLRDRLARWWTRCFGR